ncbi:MAG TPA: hypothetical protein VGO93_10395 [Candidatus Xenobia bacterium]|jgi:hypothetical protein
MNSLSQIQPGLGATSFNSSQGLQSLLGYLQGQLKQSGSTPQNDQSGITQEAEMEMMVNYLEQEIAQLQTQLQQAQQSNDPSANDLSNQIGQLQQELNDMQGSGGGGGGGFDPSSLFSGSDVPAGGGGGSSSGSSSGSSGGAAVGTPSTGPVDVTPATATGDPSQAVQIAESIPNNTAAGSLKMPNYTAAGGVTNDCADFVSACCADAGDFKKTSGDASVATFAADMQHQGWTAVSQANAKPGDVVIINGGGIQHTELVANKGATDCVGSNGTSTESITHDNPMSWAPKGAVTIYQPPAKH